MSSLTAVVDLPLSARTVGDARGLVLGLVAAWRCDVPVVDLALLVDELSSWVVERAAPGATLSVELAVREQTLRLSLVDDATVLALARDLRHDPRMGLACALARAWGDDALADGHRVWFELGPAAPDAVDGPDDPAPDDPGPDDPGPLRRHLARDPDTPSERARPAGVERGPAVRIVTAGALLALVLVWRRRRGARSGRCPRYGAAGERRTGAR